MPNVNFTPDKLQQLIKEYENAVKLGKESFVFEGSELLTSYAKYLIEYLKTQLK
jgi:hypothetical protein